MARRGKAIRRSGWPGWVSVAMLPSTRTRSIGPPRRCSRTLVRPVPAVVWARITGAFSASASQAASRSVLGLSDAPLTVTASTPKNGGWSSAAARSPRQKVVRVHARSVSPAAYASRRRSSSLRGEAAEAASVMRRCAIMPMGSRLGTAGARPGHHATTGESGSCRGVSTLSPCEASLP